MSSVCLTNCVNDARRPQLPLRAVYVNLHRWAESDAEIVKSASSSGSRVLRYGQYAGRVVDSISCRQMYPRSYRFSKRETVPEKTRRCFGREKEKMGQRKKRKKVKGRRRKCLVWRKMREFSCAALLFGIFRRILACAASIDVVEQNTRRLW